MSHKRVKFLENLKKNAFNYSACTSQLEDKSSIQESNIDLPESERPDTLSGLNVTGISDLGVLQPSISSEPQNSEVLNEDLQLSDDTDVDPNYEVGNDSESSSRSRVSVKDRQTVKSKRPRSEEDTVASFRSMSPAPGTSRKGRELRKALRNQGKAYLSYKGNLVKERKMKVLANCRMECGRRISEEDRLQCFTEYWAMGSRDRRANYISSLISIKPKKTHKLASADIRSCSCSYKLIVKSQDVPICKCCFAKTLGETKGFIDIVVGKKKASSSGIIPPDSRGLAPPANKRNSAEIQDVNDHIDSFPYYESHYCRAQSSKKYLSSDLSISKMYKLYKETRSNPVSLSFYTQCFNKKNLRFKRPKKDTCHKCDMFEVKLQTLSGEEKIALIAEKNSHHLQAEKAYASKRSDKEIAKANPSKKVFAFDLQQCLATPHLTTSVAFYKRKLWSFNLTIHDLENDKATCYMWDETISGRGANQIASCLYRHLQSLPLYVKEVTYYSDQCAGQNKNNIVSIMFLLALNKCPAIEIINHKFLTSGHTHMECDSDHAVIERVKKNTRMKINHLNDWMQLVRIAKTKNPFEVFSMEMHHFFDFNYFTKKEGPFQIKKVDTAGQKFLWAPIQWLQFRKTEGKFYFKHNFDQGEFNSINFKRKGRQCNASNLPLLHNGPVAISAAKKKDLMDLLPMIDRTFHDFYKNLKTDNSLPIDPDLERSDPDEDVID